VVSLPAAKAVPGVRVAYADGGKFQHATDAGALVVVVRPIDTEEEAIAPATGPTSHRWAAQPGWRPSVWSSFWGNVPAATGRRPMTNRADPHDETLEGIKKRLQDPRFRRDRGVCGHGDLGNFSGYKQGSPDYERLINVVHDARSKPASGCADPSPGAIVPITPASSGQRNRGYRPRVGAELGPLKDTQGKVDVGPYAPRKVTARERC